MPRGKQTDSARRARAFDAQNALAARIILEDPERYPGLLQEWAELVIHRPCASFQIPLLPPQAKEKS